MNGATAVSGKTPESGKKVGIIIAVIIVFVLIGVGIYYFTRDSETSTKSAASAPSPMGTPAPAPAPFQAASPLQTLLTSAKAIQIAEVDPATLTGAWSSAITPTDPTGSVIRYSFTMDVNLDSTWSTVAGSTYNLFKHAESPDFYINNGGAAGATWGADARNGVCIFQSTVGASTTIGKKLQQVYRNSFTPGSGWKNITFICDGTDIKYYVNGILDANITGAAGRTNKTGIKWNTAAWTWGGMTGTAAPPVGKSKIRNFYWWSDKALTPAEQTTLLGNSATSGSLGSSTYMPEPFTGEKAFAGY